MKRFLLVLSIVLSFSIVSNAENRPWPGLPNIPGLPSIGGPKTVVVKEIRPTQSLAELTIMSYEGGDNNLDPDLTNDVNEMAKSGAPAGTNIVVAYDGEKTSWRGVVTKGQITKENIPSFNSADPVSLAGFIAWAAKIRPAKKYMLIMSDHGAGWMNFLPEVKSRKRSIIVDEKTKTEMSIRQVRQVLEKVQTLGIKFDIVAFDACLMGMSEIYYELSGVANIVIGSEETEPGAGWPYNKIYQNIKSLDGVSMSKVIVSEYIKSYKVKDGATLAAVDVKKFKQVTDELITKYSASLIANPNFNKNVYLKARAATLKYQPIDTDPQGIDTYADFIDFLRIMGDENSKKLSGWLAATVIATGNTGGGMKNSNGISIYLPKTNVASEYANVKFGEASGWTKVLTKVLGTRRK